jgi:hypothetical protein
MATNSVSDSECIMAAEAVEKLDRELDELQKVLDDWTQSTATQTEANQPSDIDALAAWLQGFKPEPEPSNWSKTPRKLNNLLTKPVEQSWLDERAMNSFDYLAAREKWAGSNSASPITISSDGSAALPSTSFTTPDRPIPEHNTYAPKKKNYRSVGANSRRYSRWSLSRLQSEFIRRLQPLSQKHINDVDLMARALHDDDVEQARKTSMASTSSSLISQPTTKKQRTK